MLIPLFDIDVPVLAAHREAFASAGTVVVTADPEAVGICNDKWRTHRALAEAGIRVLRPGWTGNWPWALLRMDACPGLLW